MNTAVIEQPNLLGEIADPPTRPETPLETARRKKKLAYAAVSSAWKRSVEKFAREVFLPKHREFICEDLRAAYYQSPGAIQIPNPKAWAGMMGALNGLGLIENLIVNGEQVFERRSQGSPAVKYRSLL